MALALRLGGAPQALADYLGLTKGTVSQSLQLLERKGLIARLPDDADRRVLRLSLTADGEALIGDAGAPAEWPAALAALPEAEAAAAGARVRKPIAAG